MPRWPVEMLNKRDLLKGFTCLGIAGASRGYARNSNSERFPTVRSLITSMIGAGAFPGAIVAIGRGIGSPHYVSSGRISVDGRLAVDRNSLFRIYSMTKPITGMATMLLVAEGRLKLDQPVADLIPSFANMRVLTAPDQGLQSRPAAAAMTIRHLLTHTAGLGGGPTMKKPLKLEYERLGLVQALRSRAERLEQTTPPVTSLAAYADALARAPLLADPGVAWSYSVGLDLLGRVIEVASGLSFEEFLKRRFFEPLRMTSTSFQVPASAKARLASNYMGRGASLVELDPGPSSIFLDAPAFPSGGGGLVSTAHDYDRFLAMLANRGKLGGVEIMPPTAVAMGTSNLLPPAVSMRNYVGIPGVIGFGAGGSICNHGGFNGLYGWMGAAGTIGFIVPSQQVRVTGLVNNMSVFDFAIGLARAAHADL